MFQKLIATLLTYTIGFQLIFGAIPNSSFSMTAWAGSCDAGLQWNELLGRCLTTEEAAKVKEANAQCMSLGTQELQKQCLNQAIQARINEAEADGTIYSHQKVNPAIVSIILNIAGLLAAVMYFPKKSGECSLAYSAWAILGGAVAVVAGEILSAVTYKKKIDEANKELEKVSESTEEGTGSDIQAGSFTALIKREDATISAAKTKKTLYTISTAAYTIGLALSIYEAIMMSNPYTTATYTPNATCPNATQTDSIVGQTGDTNLPGFNQNSSLSEIISKKNQSIAESYVDNFFEKNQRANYSDYIQVANLETANSLTDIVLLQEDQKRLVNGLNSSIPYTAYSELNDHLHRSQVNLSNEEITMYKVVQKLAQSFTVQKANAMPLPFIMPALSAITGGMAPAAATAAVKSTTTTASGLKKLFLSPYTRMALAGILMANNIFMLSHISKQIKRAEERKAFIEELLQQTTAAGTAFGCTASDRSGNVSKPQCYCYTEAGTLNPARSKSATCAAFFGGKPVLASSNSSNSATGSKAERTCVNSSGQPDANCSCASNNSCATIANNLPATGVPTGLFGNLPATLNGLNNGSLTSSGVDTAQLSALAARAKKFQEKVLADPKNKAVAAKAKKAQKDGLALLENMRRGIAGNSALASSGNGFNSNFDTSNPKAALDQMKEELKQEIKGINAPNEIPLAGGSGGKKGDDFDMNSLLGGSDGSGVTIEDEKLAEVMGSEYDMSAGEINSDSGANIFQILSNRYQRSGMRRLFGGEAIVPADKPNESQISQ